MTYITSLHKKKTFTPLSFNTEFIQILIIGILNIPTIFFKLSRFFIPLKECSKMIHNSVLKLKPPFLL